MLSDATYNVPNLKELGVESLGHRILILKHLRQRLGLPVSSSGSNAGQECERTDDRRCEAKPISTSSQEVVNELDEDSIAATTVYFQAVL